MICPHCHRQAHDPPGHRCDGRDWVMLWYFRRIFGLLDRPLGLPNPDMWREYCEWRGMGYSRGDVLAILGRAQDAYTPNQIADFARATISLSEWPGPEWDHLGGRPLLWHTILD